MAYENKEGFKTDTKLRGMSKVLCTCKVISLVDKLSSSPGKNQGYFKLLTY